MESREGSEKMYGYKELQELLGSSYVTLWRWIRDGKFPPPDFNETRSPKWLSSTVTAWQRGEWKGKDK